MFEGKRNINFLESMKVIHNKEIAKSTEVLKKHCKNITWKYCKIAKIFRNLSLMLLKYCNNLPMSAQNMTYAIFSKYFQNEKIHKQYFFK